MAGQLKLRRGTTSQLANFVGSEGELTYDTALKSLVLHDGVTLGGVKIPYLSNGLVPSTMLPTATDSVVGASKIATTAIAQAGTNDTDFITALKLHSTSFGLGQSWQNVTASRAIGTVYTNTTGKTIFVNFMSINGSPISTTVTVDGVIVANPSNNVTGTSSKCVAYFPVPNGSTYTITGAPISLWAELR